MCLRVWKNGRCRRLPPCITQRNCESIGYTEHKRNKGNREEGGGVYFFIIGKFESLALVETKLKRNVEVPWCGENGIIAGVQEMDRL